MEYVAESKRNPFGMQPPCERFVPGYGDPNADFHVIGDHPGRHGGESSEIPFTDRPWSRTFFDALETSGLIQGYDLREEPDIQTRGTFFSYLHMCLTAEGLPSKPDYDRLEPFFDAELRAITAHVLLPVGERATEHVLRTYTSKSATNGSAADLHATDIRGAGWLVVPIKDPETWNEDDEAAVVETLSRIRDGDYRQISDLGRFRPGEEPYFVR